ncbi:hypothetical protein [Borrelia hermsii]|uniref:hypothetical protein n=1 Tax=Borrelia hermsii TaxID=140 RepID=UPI00046D60AD|nr:hypothetical protein [Borrelia hermsii]
MSHADTTGVIFVIQCVTKLIDSVSKLARVTKEGGSIPIGDANTVGGAADEEVGVNVIIKRVKEIIEVAEKSGVKISTGNAGVDVASGGSPWCCTCYY